MDTQNEIILAALKQGRSLTPLEALQQFGCFRLAARVHDLRHSGYDIVMTRKTLPNGKCVAEYRLNGHH